MDKQFRIVFRGAIRSGADPTTVRQQAALRLKASSAQIERVFSGERVILKQNLDTARTEIYQRALEQLGMIVSVEDMSPSTPARQTPPPPLPLILPLALTSPPPQHDSTDYSHFERTHLNLARAEALLNGHAQEEPPLPVLLVTPEISSPILPARPATSDASTGMARNKTLQNDIQESALIPDHRAARLPPHEETTASAALPAAALAARLAIQPPAGAPPDQDHPASAPTTLQPMRFSSHFRCSHCGAEHQLESLLQLNLTSMPRQERDAG